MKKSEKILNCKEEIKDYIGGCSDYMFKKYITLGMPARYEDGRWLAFADNIDKFFMAYTNVSMKKSLDQIPEET